MKRETDSMEGGFKDLNNEVHILRLYSVLTSAEQHFTSAATASILWQSEVTQFDMRDCLVNEQVAVTAVNNLLRQR